ncbi:RND family efflux transporter, MFP subunit [Bernardetia litoralis DSM 6794]|uniref:RND family efflux transporter, MFP subunit n=1 Tax=Bernardetia litoralis (strain ATCC 23117 / DSM 6794 / NBRC 15988 / NCIMB 1366 / Fx l1 / Sio-4) TaxID=880071 RepID=I4AKP3_BERLS|nr:efflux RND transporter periplasmic adaptor subunit [Bernardetia litoralis]AFM04528.1 RND family efflux transporter, MFP subunit [Bernardetia litoralis DSM 6794]
MKTNIIYSILFLCSIFLFWSCKKTSTTDIHVHDDKNHSHDKEIMEDKNHSFFTNEQIQKLGIEIDSSYSKSIPTIIEATGTIHLPPQNKALVGSVLGGKIKKILIHEGDYVKKGQTIAILENPEAIKMQQEYFTVSARLIMLESDLERQKSLQSQDATTEKIVQQAQAELEMAKSQKAGLKAQLQMINLSTNSLSSSSISSTFSVLAPISGMTHNIVGQLGEFIDANKSMVDILNEDHLHIEILVYEKDIDAIKEKQKVTFIPYNSSHAKPVEAIVYSISNTIDPVTKTVSIHAEIKQKLSTILRDGTLGKIKIESEGTNRATLPKDALVQTRENFFVFIQKNKTDKGSEFEKIEVELYAQDKTEFQFSIKDNSINKSISELAFITKGAYYLNASSAETVGHSH